MFDYRNDKELVRQKEQYQIKEDVHEEAKTSTSKTTFNFEFKKNDKVDEVLNRPRSQAFLDAIAAIDLLSSTDEMIIEKLKANLDEDTLDEFKEMTTEELLEEIKLSISEEMEAREAKLEDVPEPPFPEIIVSKCYISGCDIHSIDKNGMILDHYNMLTKLDGGLANARKLFHKNKDCNCIEVYSNKCVVVNQDGTTKIYYNEDL